MSTVTHEYSCTLWKVSCFDNVDVIQALQDPHLIHPPAIVLIVQDKHPALLQDNLLFCYLFIKAKQKASISMPKKQDLAYNVPVLPPVTVGVKKKCSNSVVLRVDTVGGSYG